MRLPRFTSLLFACLFACPLYSQVVPYTVQSSTSNSGSSVNPSSENASQSLINFSLLSWRIGQLSPTALTITTSSVTAKTSAPPAIPSVQDPFVAPAISLQGGLSNNSIITTTDTPATIQTTPMGRWSFAPNFLRFNSLIPDNGISTSVNTPIPQEASSVSLFDINKYDTSVQPLAMSVPEPGTMALCGGALLAAGYYWLRRKPASPASGAEQVESPPDDAELCLSK